MVVPQVLNKFRHAIELHGFDDGPIRREMVNIFGAVDQRDAAGQDLRVNSDICDAGVELYAEGVDDVVIGKVDL